jgi:hypothetical protein
MKNGGRDLALPCCEKPHGQIPSIDQNPFGRPIRAACLFPFSGKEKDEKAEQWKQPKQRRDLRVQEQQEKVRCALLAGKPLIACLRFSERSLTKPSRSDGDQVLSLPLVIAPEE